MPCEEIKSGDGESLFYKIEVYFSCTFSPSVYKWTEGLHFNVLDHGRKTSRASELTLLCSFIAIPSVIQAGKKVLSKLVLFKCRPLQYHILTSSICIFFPLQSILEITTKLSVTYTSDVTLMEICLDFVSFCKCIKNIFLKQLTLSAQKQ